MKSDHFSLFYPLMTAHTNKIERVLFCKNDQTKKYFHVTYFRNWLFSTSSLMKILIWYLFKLSSHTTQIYELWPTVATIDFLNQNEHPWDMPPIPNLCIWITLFLKKVLLWAGSAQFVVLCEATDSILVIYPTWK